MPTTLDVEPGASVTYEDDAFFGASQVEPSPDRIWWVETPDGQKVGRITEDVGNQLFLDQAARIRAELEQLSEGLGAVTSGAARLRTPVDEPHFLGHDDDGASWWIYKLDFFCDHEGRSAEDGQAAVLDAARALEAAREAQIEAEFEANAARLGGQLGMTAEDVGRLSNDEARELGIRYDSASNRLVLDGSVTRRPRRGTIPDDVKIFVWRRDEGKCIGCGSNSNLEFDHIIPLSRGGSNTARNLQLLCEPCNRSKGGNLT